MCIIRKPFTKYRKEDKMNSQDVYLGIKEVAELLGLKYHHTRNLLYADEEFKCYSYGRTRRWKLSDIIAFREKHLVCV